MIQKIAHLGDIHIRKSPSRNEEYQKVFETLYKSLEEQKPDRIVIVGDLVHDYLNLESEQLVLASNFLNTLANIAPVRITRGNHDFLRKNNKRTDSIEAITKILNNPNIIYYNKTGFYDDENVTWVVWHHGDKNNNSWKTKQGKQIEIDRKTNKRVYIDLFHDPINGCKTTTGFEMKSKSYYKLSDFKSDFGFFADIHIQQYLDKNKTKGYCGSLVSQDVTEGDSCFHGYLLWNILNKTVQEIPIYDDYSFKNIRITQYVDFDDLDFEIENPTKYMKIRFIWGTLPQTRTKENERKVIEYLKSKHKNVTISHKNEFLENEKIDVNENVSLQNVTTKEVQHEIFKEFLTKIGSDEQLVNDVIALDEEILTEIDIVEDQSIEWNVVKFGGKNFMSYGQFDIDWRNEDGLYQIIGKNTFGKTTILKSISYALFGKTLETETRMKYGDIRFINNRNGATSCEVYMIIEANGEYFGIKKKTEINKNKCGEITGAPTTLSYYMLATPDDEMNDETSIEKLDENHRVKTQKKVESIIGSYDNFMRIVMTTSDSLNRILSNDMSTFIDSLLYDSGLDIFDKKLEGLKVYQKRVNEKPRVLCNVEFTNMENARLQQEIIALEGEITQIETVKLPDIQNRIEIGRKYVEDLSKKLYKIDSEIYNLDVDKAREDISANKKNIIEIKAQEMVLKQSIIPLKETYDIEKLKILLEQKDTHKTTEYNKKLEIKNLERLKSEEEHKIEIINGDIFKLKQDGIKLKKEIADLKNSKICSQCGQVIEKQEHKDHIENAVKEKEKEMYIIADKINVKQAIDIHEHQIIINVKINEIEKINESIKQSALEMEEILKEIGTLTNEKNDVEKRKELQIELDQVPIKIQNEELKIGILEQKITSHENSLLQIE